MKYTVTVDGEVFEIEVGSGGRAWVNQEPYDVDMQRIGGKGSMESAGEYSLLVDHRSYDIHLDDSDNGDRWLMVSGRPYRARLQRGHGVCGNGRGQATAESGVGEVACSQSEVRAPLPGMLVDLRVRRGEHVEERQVVAVVESMKMNLEVRAPRDGVVSDLRVAPGRQVAQDEVLAVLRSNGHSRSD